MGFYCFFRKRLLFIPYPKPPLVPTAFGRFFLRPFTIFNPEKAFTTIELLCGINSVITKML
ncbi:hypothetical protein EZMO1_0978 [Endozoicomonas montiporae CL-33]|uniref:Uncharacterized protein n=1 Tax=Endozoicomonas montiporae CL-33 TaxID=570277 RepID=A0A142B8W6_9GAMM|nr:hypothetical protein EZMO1_0978 [Endozoicomonas montiporae CL-33]